MNSHYFETRFRTSQPVGNWPSQFVILSAYATTGETWTNHRNEEADRSLSSALQARGGWLVRIVGYSPTTGHAEPSWAVELPLEEACDIGKSFRQDAIYHVKNDELSVSRCDEQRALVRVGSFRDRLEVDPDARSGDSDDDGSEEPTVD